MTYEQLADVVVGCVFSPGCVQIMDNEYPGRRLAIRWSDHGREQLSALLRDLVTEVRLETAAGPVHQVRMESAGGIGKKKTPATGPKPPVAGKQELSEKFFSLEQPGEGHVQDGPETARV